MIDLWCVAALQRVQETAQKCLEALLHLADTVTCPLSVRQLGSADRPLYRSSGLNAV